MAMTIPVLPVLPAGYIPNATDLNNLVSACSFILSGPAAMVYDNTGGQALATSPTAITYTTKWFDTDGMWASGSPTLLTVQTPGYYKIRYMTQDNGVCFNCHVLITTGTNNPSGAGNTQQCWPSYSDCLTTAAGGAAGVLPVYMYAGDDVSIIANPNAAATQSITDVGSFMSMELVSI